MVHFDGAWTDEERDRVVTAIRQVEETNGSLHEEHPIPGKPWVCVRAEVPRLSFFAQRRGWPRVMTGSSADEFSRQGTGVGSRCTRR